MNSVRASTGSRIDRSADKWKEVLENLAFMYLVLISLNPIFLTCFALFISRLNFAFTLETLKFYISSTQKTDATVFHHIVK